ncbi:MAG: hypothetical protein IKM11_05805 [Oscillospiraceae bacterium]|nr:hypothetical protein [Oscillospiraceae bacterium]
MKLMGALLILASAGGGYLVYRHSSMLTLRLLREIADDLPLLRYRICVQRCALPWIIENDLRGGLSGRYLWIPLADNLAHADRSFCICWDQSTGELPPLIAQRLSPLGKLLPAGGELLSDAMDEIHRELLRLACEQQERQTIHQRLSAAVCFSAAALLVLVCL